MIWGFVIRVEVQEAVVRDVQPRQPRQPPEDDRCTPDVLLVFISGIGDCLLVGLVMIY